MAQPKFTNPKGTKAGYRIGKALSPTAMEKANNRANTRTAAANYPIGQKSTPRSSR